MESVSNTQPTHTDTNPAKGARVTRVLAGPAQKAGIQEGDVIVEINGSPVDDPQDIIRIVARAKPGHVLDVLVVRNGDTRTFATTLGRRETDAPTEKPDTYTFGNLQLRDTQPKDLDTMGLPPRLYTVVVETSTPSLDAGDVLVSINNTPIVSAQEMVHTLYLLQKANNPNAFIHAARKGQSVFTTFPISAEKP
jgi:serine protease Do